MENNIVLFSNIESEVIIAKYVASYLFILLIVQLRSGFYKRHKIPLAITVIFTLNSFIKPYFTEEMFLLWHSIFIIFIAILSWNVYYKAKAKTKVKVNLIPMIVLLIYVFLHTLRPYLNHSDFMMIHGIIAAVVVTLLTFLPMWLSYCKSKNKNSILEKYIY